ncbi:MAG: hypothetical protein PHZ11_06105 [Desulfitobacteriaceae bacterium]|nr:hypothetical protein [Desulfitobacteriaceae bacterium]MDD4346457.1 hypothetical protein [Desulfitobacteriaceae bacterium]MDD4401937.1 hypothetical protein [Desulfitobacteriaceae bacterium]
MTENCERILGSGPFGTVEAGASCGSLFYTYLHCGDCYRYCCDHPGQYMDTTGLNLYQENPLPPAAEETLDSPTTIGTMPDYTDVAQKTLFEIYP